MHPTLTQALPGIGGRIKERPEDFVVEELPLYAPSGEGEHTFFEIRKVGLSTFQAIREVARGLGISPERIGYAGLKDAQAVARQVLSAEGVPPERVAALKLAGVQVLWARRHRQTLKVGHLAGNRFAIRVRGVDRGAAEACRPILAELARRGVPNRYGAQRFGLRGDSARLGRSILRGDARSFVRTFLGEPSPAESERVQFARARFEAGQWEEALRAFPDRMADERRALQVLIRTQGDYRQAFATLPKRLKVFLLSALQSALFNRVLEARLESLDQVYAGDLAMKHPGHSVFRVEDEAAEQPRAARFEISPTGPVYGYRMMEASGPQGQLEARVLSDEGLCLQDFRVGEGIRMRGERRALRFALNEPEVSYDDGVLLRFWLPSGCYATAVLAEVTKQPQGPDVTELTEL